MTNIISIRQKILERDERARLAHRERCREAANRLVASCASLGVDVVVFGSLVKKGAFFRKNSDVDLCILNGLSAAITYFDIEALAEEYFNNIPFDLWAADELKKAVLINVKKDGVRHVD